MINMSEKQHEVMGGKGGWGWYRMELSRNTEILLLLYPPPLVFFFP